MSLFLMLGLVSNSLFVVWLSIEVLMVSFLILIIKKSKGKLSYEIMNYFIIQAVVGLGVCFSLVGYFININYILLVLLMVKLGMIPFHYWYFFILLKLKWMEIYVLSTWMKILPLKLIFLKLDTGLMNMLGCVNILFASVFIMKEKKIKKLVGWSSIFNYGWVFFTMNMINLCWVYLVTYFLNFFFFLNFMSLSSLDSIYSVSMLSKFMLVIFLVLVLLMMGIPPFLGFIIKVMAVLVLINSYFWLALIMLFTLIMMFIYFMFIFLSLLCEKSFQIHYQKDLVLYITPVMLINFFLNFIFMIFYYLNNK